MKRKSPLQIAEAFFHGTLTNADRAKLGPGMRELIALAESRDPAKHTAKLFALQDLFDIRASAWTRTLQDEVRDLKEYGGIMRIDATIKNAKLRMLQSENAQLKRLVGALRDEIIARNNANPAIAVSRVEQPAGLANAKGATT